MNRFTIERLSNPDIEALTVAEVKRNLNMFTDLTDRDSQLEGLIAGAREFLEEYSGRVLIDCRWKLTVLDYEEGPIFLHRSPILAIESVTAIDSDGTETAVDVEGSPAATNYVVYEATSKRPTIAPLAAAWPEGRIEVIFRAGFADRVSSPVGTAAAVPEIYKTAMYLWIEAMYDRDPVMMEKLEDAAKCLLKPHRLNLQLG